MTPREDSGLVCVSCYDVADECEQRGAHSVEAIYYGLSLCSCCIDAARSISKSTLLHVGAPALVLAILDEWNHDEVPVNEAEARIRRAWLAA